MIVRISSWPSILTRLAFSTFSSLPRRARMAWTLESRPCLARAAGGVAFDEEQLGVLVALAAAVGELAGQAAAFQAVLAAGQLPRLAGRLAGLGGHASPSRRSRLASLGFSSKKRPSFSLTADCTKPSTSLLPSLSFVWPSNCGSGIFTLMTAISPSRTSSPVGRDVLESALLLGVAVDGAGEGGLEPAQVRAALVGVDVVGEGERSSRCSRRCTASRLRRRGRRLGSSFLK